MTLEEIRSFLNDRPAINILALCREAGIKGRYQAINAYVAGKRDRIADSDEVVNALAPVLERYGFYWAKAKEIINNFHLDLDGK